MDPRTVEAHTVMMGEGKPLVVEGDNDCLTMETQSLLSDMHRTVGMAVDYVHVIPEDVIAGCYLELNSDVVRKARKPHDPSPLPDTMA